jgi:hypothetical protein
MKSTTTAHVPCYGINSLASELIGETMMLGRASPYCHDCMLSQQYEGTSTSMVPLQDPTKLTDEQTSKSRTHQVIVLTITCAQKLWTSPTSLSRGGRRPSSRGTMQLIELNCQIGYTMLERSWELRQNPARNILRKLA